jgi:tetratricopeptide (TPR) repeat protein
MRRARFHPLKPASIAGLVIACLSLGIVLSFAQEAQPAATPAAEMECPPIPVGIPQDFTYYVGQGDSLFARVLYTAAAESYTCALNLQPDYAPAYVRRGYAYAAIGDSERALADYEQAAALDELYLPTYINRGALYVRLGNFGLAINDLTLVLSLEPENTAALNNRAVVHAIEGNYDLALADLDAAIQLDAQDPLPYATRAAVYSALAARDYQQFLVVHPNAPLPAGTPPDVLTAVDDSIRTGDFSIWLSLLTAAAGTAG